MKINKSAVYNWIKALNKKIEEQKSEIKEEGPKEVIEMDKLYSYVERKNKNYLVTFVTRKPRQIVCNKKYS